MKTKENHNEIRSLYERYASMVHRRCRTFLKTEEDAWDATQEVFMKLVDALPKINKKESIYSWLLSTSTNHCISILRKKKHVSFDENIHSAESKQLPQEKGQSGMKFSDISLKTGILKSGGHHLYLFRWL